MLSVYEYADKSGTVTMVQNGRTFVMPIYGEDKCNCFMACLWESLPKEDGLREYQWQWFFGDESHGKRMLGLAKTYDGTKTNCLSEITKLTIYKSDCANWKKIVTMFAQAFDKITIEILAEQPKEDENT